MKLLTWPKWVGFGTEWTDFRSVWSITLIYVTTQIIYDPFVKANSKVVILHWLGDGAGKEENISFSVQNIWLLELMLSLAS